MLWIFIRNINCTGVKGKSLFILVFVLFPKMNFGQSPNLGAASSFVLFTAVGAFTNVGATVATGDIGTNAGAFTGFPPGTINGQTHLTDSVSLQAASDADSAYSFMNAITCDTVIGVVLGNNQILSPNVYCMGASSLNGDLTLDAQGDPNALFIFKINGALAANSLSNVILINSASMCNVYWQVNGEFDLGDSSVFQGTVIANGALNLLDGSTLEGRGLSIGGAINISTMTASLSCSPSQIVLPIELLFFNGSDKHAYNLLS